MSKAPYAVITVTYSCEEESQFEEFKEFVSKLASLTEHTPFEAEEPVEERRPEQRNEGNPIMMGEKRVAILCNRRSVHKEDVSWMCSSKDEAEMMSKFLTENQILNMLINPYDWNKLPDIICVEEGR